MKTARFRTMGLPGLGTVARLAGVAVLLAGCGGGGSSPEVVPGGGGSGLPMAAVAQGEVTGLSPLTVSGVSFTYLPGSVSVDDADDDGLGLQLGMVARVQGGQSTGNPLSVGNAPGLASSIGSSAELRGPAVVLPTVTPLPQVQVLGVAVRITPTTRFENLAAGLSDVANGDMLQVHGYPTDNGQVIATRVQRRGSNSVLKAAGAVSYGFCRDLCDLSGTVIQIGTMQWRLTRDVVRDLPFPLPEGTMVRVRTAQMPVAGELPVASEVTPYSGAPLLQDAITTMRGVVVAPFAGVSESGFFLNGFRVVYDPQSSLAIGGRPDIAAGVLVEVQGRHRSGQLSISALTVLPS